MSEHVVEVLVDIDHPVGQAFNLATHRAQVAAGLVDIPLGVTLYLNMELNFFLSQNLYPDVNYSRL